MRRKWKVESRTLKMVCLMLCCIGLNLNAPAQKKNQNNTSLTKEEMANYETEIRKMVNYLQETLNFIGDPTQTAQEKEIIFTQSYAKIFLDDKVQIEDDLDTKRSTTLSKDVQAYLKDIDFFFQYAQFSFNIQSIANLNKPDGSPYFKVTMNRQLVGKTVTNDSINEVKNRFIEINLDKKNNDLKIASIYTTKINEKQSLQYWWNSMPSAWKDYFGKDLKMNDSIPLKSVMQVNDNDFIYAYPILSTIEGETIVTDWKEVVVKTGVDTLYKQLKTLSMTQVVDVNGIKTITTLDPLAELSDLSVLNISGTNTNDLTPLRNANKLKVLKVADTRINDLSPLKYDLMITELDVSHTDVDDLSILNSLGKLEKLNVAYTQVNNLKAIEQCHNLKYLIAEGKKYDVCVAIGPMIMMKFVCLLTKEYNLPTIVSLNPIMVDGTGMCGACRVTVGGKVKFACVDGPEFDGHQVNFDEAMRRQLMYKTQEGKAMLALEEGDTHHGGCGNC